VNVGASSNGYPSMYIPWHCLPKELAMEHDAIVASDFHHVNFIEITNTFISNQAALAWDGKLYIHRVMF
jgi:hypothetical protein